MLSDSFFQVCPKCGLKSRSKVVSKTLRDKNVVESTKRTWSRSGNWPVDEPFSVWVYTYDVVRRCRSCAHQWAEKTTKQRAW